MKPTTLEELEIRIREAISAVQLVFIKNRLIQLPSDCRRSKRIIIIIIIIMVIFKCYFSGELIALS